MSFFDKIKNAPEQFLYRGSNEVFVASIIKISTFNKDVSDCCQKCKVIIIHH